MRFVPYKMALLKLAFWRLEPYKLAPDRSAPSKFALIIFTLVRLTPIKLQYEKSTCPMCVFSVKSVFIIWNISEMLSLLLSINELQLLRSSENTFDGINRTSAIIVILYKYDLSNISKSFNTLLSERFNILFLTSFYESSYCVWCRRWNS